jgi:hypothetical protein
MFCYFLINPNNCLYYNFNSTINGVAEQYKAKLKKTNYVMFLRVAKHKNLPWTHSKAYINI